MNQYKFEEKNEQKENEHKLSLNKEKYETENKLDKIQIGMNKNKISWVGNIKNEYKFNTGFRSNEKRFRFK